jgi:hypothetical protein
VKLEKEIASKTHLHLHENYISYTVLCFLEKNIEENFIVKQKRGSVLWSCLMLLLLETAMVVCMMYAVWVNENNEYARAQAHSFQLFLIKVPCVIALHFYLNPEVDNAMRIMKYANQ